MGTVLVFGVAVPVIELILGGLVLTLILGMAGTAVAGILWGGDAVKRLVAQAKYPVSVPGWGTKLSSPPPFKATLEDIAYANLKLLTHAVVYGGYDEAKVRKNLDNSLVEFIKADPQTGGRAIIDPYGRRVPVKNADGTPKLDDHGNAVTTPAMVAGWSLGNTLHVVYLPDDTLEKTAYCHEQGHVIQLVNNVVDYTHSDMKMFGPDGIVIAVHADLRQNRERNA